MKQGLYGGGTFGFPSGFGGGLYIDSYGNLYPQLYMGTPGWGVSGGSTTDLEGLLTGLSVGGTLGRAKVGPNVGTSGGANGFGFATPGAGATYGFGPIPTRDIFDFRPRTDEFGQPFPGSEAPSLSPSNNSGSQGQVPAGGNPVLKFLNSFRPTTDEFGNPFRQGPGGVLKYGSGSPVQDVPPLQSDKTTPADAPQRILVGRRYDPSQGAPARPPVPSQPSPDGSLSLNDAYLEYLRRLNAQQQQGFGDQ